MQNTPYFTSWSVDKTHPLRMIRPPNTTGDNMMEMGENIDTFWEYFYILVTGAPTGTADLVVG